MTACNVCHGSTAFAFSQKVLGRYDATYVKCGSCGFLQAHEPNWLDDAYSSALTRLDTGAVSRNLSTAKRVALFLALKRGMSRPSVDIGGGHGLLTRLMRDVGADFYWEDKYAANLFARGFESDRMPGPAFLMTAFEVLEHLPLPRAFIADAHARHNPTFFLTSTEVLPDGPTPGADWPYYAFEHGQHISFYTRKSLEEIARGMGMSVAIARTWQLFGPSGESLRSILGLITSRLATVAYPVIRRISNSRTSRDYELLLRDLRESQRAS